MKRSMCGIVVLAAAAGLWSCNGDPTEAIREGESVRAEPSVVFVDQGSTEFVTVQLLDGQGNQLAADFQAQDIGPGITVAKDTTFLPTTTGSLETRERFIVSGLSATSTSFVIAAGGTTDTIAVRVLPTAIAATISNPAPAANEPVTVTLPAGYKFGAEAGVSGDQGSGLIQSYSADSTSVVVVLPLGTAGTLTLDGVMADFLPGLNLSGVPTEATIAVSATPVEGTSSTSTAPVMAVPAIGATTGFFDVGTFTGADITGDGGVGAQYYQLVVAEAGDYTFTTDWPATSTSDLDPVVCFDAACSAGEFAGSGSDHPEIGTLTLVPGTYYFAVVLFSGAPTNFGVRIDAAATPPPAAIRGLDQTAK